MEFSIEELDEVRRSLNTIISERIKYENIEENELRKIKNNEYLTMDYILLDKVLKEVERLKELEQVQC